MMEMLSGIKDSIIEYWPVVVAFVIAVGGFVGIAYVTFTQAQAIVQPILDKIQGFRDKDDEDKSVASVLESINIESMKADLLYKIQNTSVSPELTLVYQTQLDRLMSITDKTATTINDLTDKADTYL